MNSIEIKNVTKMYKTYKKPLYRILDSIFNTKNYEEYYALEDISLSIEEGESVGVLGKNGAGKSTLLKILTGVTTPTAGSVSVNGKIAAILELNSGFDEELTGIENIYLKGTILGYKKEEIENKINDIIAFADIGKHINQPVRTYSSGMKSRLGFAIAVNSDPDVLIIDEALSVGDDIFKTKCLAKMTEFRKQGKTIFFVSHSLFTIKSFCTKCAWIKDGKLVEYGNTKEVCQNYENYLKKEKAKNIKDVKKKEGYLERKDYISVNNFKFDSSNGEYKFNQDINYSFDYEVKKAQDCLRWTFTIRDADEKEIYSSDKLDEVYSIDNAIGKHSLNVSIKSPNLLPGKYMLSGEIMGDEGMIYVGYSNKREFTVINEGLHKGTGFVFLEHKAFNGGKDDKK